MIRSKALASYTGTGQLPCTSQELTDEQLESMFLQFDTPVPGSQMIKHIRGSKPGRATKSTSYTGKLRYPSLKMGFTMEAEAFRTEMVAITEWDHDAETFEFYTQPDYRLKLKYRSAKNGKLITTRTLPDAFRIVRSGFVFTECKTEEFLLSECERQPGRFVRCADGSWSSPPAEHAAALVGCRYEIRSSGINNWALHENLELLHDLYVAHQRGSSLEVPNEVRQRLFQRMDSKLFVSAYDLVHTEPRISADHLYQMVVTHEIYFPMTSLRLSDQKSALLFRSRDEWDAHKLFLQTDCPERRTQGPRPVLQLGDIFEWSGIRYEIINPGKENISARMLDDPTNLVTLPRARIQSLPESELVIIGRADDRPTAERDERYARASPKDMQEAVWRYQLLFDEPDKRNPLLNRCERTRFMWRKAFRDADVQWGNGFLGLLPQRVGNISAKVDSRTKALAEEVIASDWETIRRKHRRTSYGEYLLRCETKAVDPVSYSTFCRMVKERSGFEQSVSRVGKKAAYNEEARYLELDRTTPVHGTHSWHICHIDHTPLPLQFLTGNSSDFACTVWLTLLVGAFDRKIYAYYLSFDEPSYRSCMMVIRDCVRRHGRFFQYVVVDNGSDFESGYFEKLLSRLYSKKRSRPKGKPRFGAVCERLFGTSQAQFVKVLLGSTDLLEKRFREISPEVRPKEQAVWILDEFDRNLDRYIDEVYHTAYHSGIDMSPNACATYSERDHGSRAFSRIPYDEQFLIETCPGPARGNVKIGNEGVKINYFWYSAPELRLPGMLGRSVPARYDPWNIGVAYLYVQGKWIVVYSAFYGLLKHCSERLLQMATAAIRAVARGRNQKANVNAQSLATYLRSVHQEEGVARQARNDAQARSHRNKIDGAASPPRKGASSPTLVPMLPAPDPGVSLSVAIPEPKRLARHFHAIEDL